MHIREQVVLVTGGTHGLGLAISHALIQEGARVVINYFSSQHSPEQLQQQYPQQVLALQANITDAT